MILFYGKNSKRRCIGSVCITSGFFFPSFQSPTRRSSCCLQAVDRRTHEADDPNDGCHRAGQRQRGQGSAELAHGTTNPVTVVVLKFSYVHRFLNSSQYNFCDYKRALKDSFCGTQFFRL